MTPTPGTPFPVNPFDVRPVPGGFDVNRVVEQAIEAANIPRSAKVAVVAVGDMEGARLACMWKPGEHWTFAMWGDKRWHKPLDVGAQVAVWF